jgi:hypothetical protein
MKSIKNQLSGAGLVFLSLIFMLSASSAGAQTMSVNPYKINLNAQGAAENIQCAYPGFLASSNISGQNIQICFAGGYVTHAYNVDYYPIDNIVFVQFDWNEVISSPVLAELANNGEVYVAISGSFTVKTNDGGLITYNVDRWDYAEVIKPGKRK